MLVNGEEKISFTLIITYFHDLIMLILLKILKSLRYEYKLNQNKNAFLKCMHQAETNVH